MGNAPVLGLYLLSLAVVLALAALAVRGVLLAQGVAVTFRQALLAALAPIVVWCASYFVYALVLMALSG